MHQALLIFAIKWLLSINIIDILTFNQSYNNGRIRKDINVPWNL